MKAAPAAVVKSRPTEATTGVAGAVAGLIVWLAGIDDPRVLGSLVVVVGFVPSAITWLVTTIRK